MSIRKLTTSQPLFQNLYTSRRPGAATFDDFIRIDIILFIVLFYLIFFSYGKILLNVIIVGIV